MQQLTASGLLQQFTSLAASFSQLGVRLSQAASALQSPGLPPSASLLTELTTARRDFTELCAGVLALAESLLVTPLPVPAELTSLSDLHPLLQRVVEAEDRKTTAEGFLHGALLTLDRVLAIIRRDGSEFPPLLECQGRAKELRSAIAEVAWPNLHPAAEALAKGEHPFAQLLTLVEGQEELDDPLAPRPQQDAASARPLYLGRRRARQVDADGPVLRLRADRSPQARPLPCLHAGGPQAHSQLPPGGARQEGSAIERSPGGAKPRHHRSGVAAVLR